MLALAAYADRLSVRPGESITFHAANTTGKPITARIVRVVCSDANPAGPGIRVEDIDASIATLSEPGPSTVPRGSYGIVDGLEPWPDSASFTILCRVYPTCFGDRRQAIITRMHAVDIGLNDSAVVNLGLFGHGVWAFKLGIRQFQLAEEKILQ